MSKIIIIYFVIKNEDILVIIFFTAILQIFNIFSKFYLEIICT